MAVNQTKLNVLHVKAFNICNMVPFMNVPLNVLVTWDKENPPLVKFFDGRVNTVLGKLVFSYYVDKFLEIEVSDNDVYLIRMGNNIWGLTAADIEAIKGWLREVVPNGSRV